MNDTFKFSLRGKDSLASKWIEQKRSIAGTLKEDGAGIFAIGDYIYEVFSIGKLSDGKITKNNLYAKIREINGLTNESIIKFEDTIDIPFVHRVIKIGKEKDINFSTIAKKLGDEKINDGSQNVSDILTSDELKIMAINYHHIQYDRRDKENIAGKTYDEIMNKPILYFASESELSFIYPDYETTQTKKIVESTINKTAISVSLNENTIQPEVNNATVEGYFYKRSTGQADSKNASYKGSSKKVYSVEDFKESYTTGDCTDLNCEYDDFRYISCVVMKECTTTNLDEYKAVAFASRNHADVIKKTWKKLMESGYSSVSDKTELLDTDKTAKANLSRRAVIFVLENNNDITDGAEFWDGEDFLAFGDCETKYDADKTGSNKFREYKFIEIPKNVYDSYSGSITFPRSFLCSHDETKCKGTHTHFDGNDGKRRAKYLSIASTFTDKANWKNNVFYVETSVNKPNGISATMAAGKSIFWKVTKDRLYNE